MENFTTSANSFLAEHAKNDERRHAWAAFTEGGLPQTSDEVWRYAPLDTFALERFAVPEAPGVAGTSALADALGARSAHVVRVVDGFLVSSGAAPAGVSITREDSGDSLCGGSLLEHYQRDSFSLLNCALSPATLVLRVDAGVHVGAPILIVYSATSGASFPRTQIVLERGAQATVIELFEGGADGLVVPLEEYELADNASLQLVNYQRLDVSAWHVARTTGLLARDARLVQGVVGLGAHYDRSRNDAELRGANASNELRTTFLGSGDQVHDFRTHQFHVAPRTTSTLLSKGAVADASRSVYTGLIEIEKGAKRTDARQTNHNLLLSPSAHADSVPNLDIRENDVMCAHASSVGPLDELQRWYLESRGVSRADAERLLIQGFFYEMLSALPTDLAAIVEADVTDTLSRVAVVAP
ncbi:MAG TPA: SufD family Fe-S cluster assembly protein [Acidimicrobiales bacterium]|nr:SufD family Fe-S cluster assembly protein [Acidimicrobiales bacterium]